MFLGFHTDVDKELNYPDDPELKGANRLIKKWLKDNSIKLPKIMLSSDHSYFSRLTGGTCFMVGYSINPKLLNAPKNKYFTEESSEYDKLNINNFPKHNELCKNGFQFQRQDINHLRKMLTQKILINLI